MEELRNILKTIQDDMKQLKKDNKEMENRITNTITQKLDDRFDHLEGQHKDMEEKIEKQEKRLKYVEKEIRKRNILLFGVPETESSYEKLEKKHTEYY